MNLNLEKNEQKLLNDLYLYNKRLEEVYFSSNKDEKIISMIEDIINEKLNRMTPKTAYKLLNNLYKDNLIDKYNGNEVKIINDLNIDLAKQRLGIDLLKIALSSKEFFDLYNDNYTTGFELYCNNNMIYYFIDICPYLNYSIILDHAETFLGLINNNKNINNTLKENVTKKFLFLYNDLEKESEKYKLTKETSSILSSRYDNFINLYLPQFNDTKNILFINHLYQAIVEMLKIKDDEVGDYSTVFMGKDYLWSLLEPLDLDYYNKFANDCANIIMQTDLTNHNIAYKYITSALIQKQGQLKEKTKTKPTS